MMPIDCIKLMLFIFYIFIENSVEQYVTSKNRLLNIYGAGLVFAKCIVMLTVD